MMQNKTTSKSDGQFFSLLLLTHTLKFAYVLQQKDRENLHLLNIILTHIFSYEERINFLLYTDDMKLYMFHNVYWQQRICSYALYLQANEILPY